MPASFNLQTMAVVRNLVRAIWCFAALICVWYFSRKGLA